MRGRISENFGLRLEKEFQNIAENDHGREYNDLKNFLESRKSDVEKITKLEEKRINEKISDKEFFREFFNYCELVFNINDKNEYLKSVLGNNYKLCLLKTKIPYAEFDQGEIIKSFLLGTFAVKEGVVIEDLEHEYTLEELIKLHNNKTFVHFANNQSYCKINDEEYRKLYSNYMNNLGELASFDFDVINNYNYLLLMTTYPEFFGMLRKKINFQTLNDILNTYNEKLAMIVDNAINQCEEKTRRYTETTEKIKTLKKHLH